MKNTMDDLRDHLFEQLERLRDADSDELEGEITRAKAINEAAGKLIDSAKVEVQYLDVTGEIEGSRLLRNEKPQLQAIDGKKRIGEG